MRLLLLVIRHCGACTRGHGLQAVMMVLQRLPQRLPKLGLDLPFVHWDFRVALVLLLNIRLADVITGSYLHCTCFHATWVFSIVGEVFESTLHGGVPDETTSCHMAAGRHVHLVLGF